jgi:predicted phosphodiesterase
MSGDGIDMNVRSAMLVGDSHADNGWLYEHVLPTARRLGVEAVIQLGDFGYWPHSESFLKISRTARRNFGVDVYFIDGNHEHFPMLSRDVGEALRRNGVAWADEPLAYRHPVELAPGFVYLPRGSRLTVAGRSTVCLGGAVSMDRASRLDRVTWFAEERITDADVDAAITRGPADLLLSHDAPIEAIIPIAAFVGIPIEFMHENDAAAANRMRLSRVVRQVRPMTMVHGHFHLPYSASVDVIPDDGSKYSAQVFGLGCNGQRPIGVVLRQGLEPEIVEETSRGRR